MFSPVCVILFTGGRVCPVLVPPLWEEGMSCPGPA